MATKKKPDDGRSVWVTEKQCAMLTEALGLIDYHAPTFRVSARAFAAASELHEAVRLLDKLEEARTRTKAQRQKELGFSDAV